MATSTDSKGFLARMSDEFKVPGTTAQAFIAEIKSLTRKDAEDFVRWFNERGQPTEAPAASIAFRPE